MRRHLQCLDDNKDVVHADGQHQERDDFDHDEGEGDAQVAKDPQRGRDGAEHDDDSGDTQGDLGVHLRRRRTHRSPSPFRQPGHMRVEVEVGQGSHQQPPAAVDVSQGQRDVDKHDDVADDHGADVAVALPVDLILDTALRAEGDGQVGVFVVLHETDESETDVREQNEYVFATRI